MPGELIVREIATFHTLTATLVPGAFENLNNAQRFFNDTPFDLNLVAVRIGSIMSVAQTPADVAQNYTAFCVAEISRQAQIAQQEGIIGSTRSFFAQQKMTVIQGGNGGITSQVGQIVLGDFHTQLMILEVQTNLFLHSQINNAVESTASLLLGECTHQFGATLYFRKGRLSRSNA